MGRDAHANRPERRNALSDTLTSAGQMLDALARDARVRVLVITGAGTACAGGDMGGVGDAAVTVRRSRDEAVRELVRRQETLTLRLAHFPRPTIAALPGPAAGRHVHRPVQTCG